MSEVDAEITVTLLSKRHATSHKTQVLPFSYSKIFMKCRGTFLDLTAFYSNGLEIWITWKKLEDI